MFEFLDTIPPNQQATGVYVAIRCLSHQAPPVFDESPEDHLVASRVLSEIAEQQDGRGWKPGDDVANKYIRILSEFVLERNKQELGADQARGQELLERVRRLYPGGGVR